MLAHERRAGAGAANGGALLIENVSAVLPYGTAGSVAVLLEEGRIARISLEPLKAPGARRLDGAGLLLAPGFIDLHSDAIEKEIRPRPGGSFPLDVALTELDKRLASCGVTSMYHCLCFGESETNDLRTAEKASGIVRAMRELEPCLTVRNRVHARFEVTDVSSVPVLKRLLDQRLVDLFSFMDHTPGQGQFKDLLHFKTYYSQAEHMSSEQAVELAAARQEIRKSMGNGHIEDLASVCVKRSIPMASHDDDSVEKVLWGYGIGISISEFPVTMEAAKKAVELGMHSLMGAPNVLRGGSLTGNLSGRDAILAGACTALGSDYAPMSVLHAVFQLARSGALPLHEAVKLATCNPAKALGIDGRLGSLKEGCEADLILVDWQGRVPRIARTFVAGREVFAAPSVGAIEPSKKEEKAYDIESLEFAAIS